MSSFLRLGPQPYLFAHSEASGKPLSSISRWPVSKMNEKSAAGGSRNAAIAALTVEGVALAVGAGAPGARGGPQLGERLGLPPKRPPDKLSQPSTLALKKSVRTNRFEVNPP